MRYACLLLLSLGGCAAEPRLIEVPVVTTVTVYETVPVPEVLLRACKVDLSALESNQDLERTLGNAILELRQCTEDKEAIREL